MMLMLDTRILHSRGKLFNAVGDPIALLHRDTRFCYGPLLSSSFIVSCKAVREKRLRSL